MLAERAPHSVRMASVFNKRPLASIALSVISITAQATNIVISNVDGRLNKNS